LNNNMIKHHNKNKNHKNTKNNKQSKIIKLTITNKNKQKQHE
jgi:hypothetical protein